MKITKFQFENKALDWRLEAVTFEKLTLLVGASGVGKTQILKSLMDLKNIANGASVGGVAWVIEFETLDNEKYVWKGEFESTGISRNGEDTYKIIFEKLDLNGGLLVDRTTENIIFNGLPTIKLSRENSILSLLKEESLIKPAHDSFDKLYFTDYNIDNHISNNLIHSSITDEIIALRFDNLKELQENKLEILTKLFFLSKADKKNFDVIIQRFIDIFPQVEDIRMVVRKGRDDGFFDIVADYFSVEIKEKGVNHWIAQNRISLGMFRTLIQLSELYLCAEGTVFLIDEFENSLGINCINEITNDILASRRQLQFILTSHHPYIIDAIGYNHWKLVTRNGNIVKTHDIDKFNIGKSKHSAFMQLIQLEEYQTGQEKV